MPQNTQDEFTAISAQVEAGCDASHYLIDNPNIQARVVATAHALVEVARPMAAYYRALSAVFKTVEDLKQAVAEETATADESEAQVN